MNRLRCLAILLPMLIVLISTPKSFASTTPQSGILVAKGYQLPDLIGAPESNVRFALWNGTIWFELPFWIKEETVVVSRQFEANGTSVSGVYSETSDTISNNDLISMQVPAQLGMKAADGNWWSYALDLGLQSRFLVQFSDWGSHSSLVYAYYQMTGRSLAPVYPSTQYSNSVPTNGTQKTLTSSSPSTSTIFEVTSVSNPQTAVLYAAKTDPQVNSLKVIILQNFAGTGWSHIPTDLFWLPDKGQKVTGAFLRIEGKDYGDGNLRYLNVWINNQPIWSGNGQTISGSFSFAPDITSMANWWDETTTVSNTASVMLTTWVGYWVVRAWIYVVYNANSNFRTAYSQYANWYKFQTHRMEHHQLPSAIAR